MLFDGDVAGVCIEPTLTLPGLRAAVDGAGKWRRWIGGRAAQLGTTGAAVLRDGVAAPRPVRRSVTRSPLGVSVTTTSQCAAT
ncbi:peptidase%2C M50 family protein [Mycobacterium tuberculosis]|uniref:Peptidase, M50 family protein n=1 Tax=Mycobacterium tuberculosis TaxID=1773 RepID=A0A0U0TE30_MYCTX|nr:peptidase%2C M50 family protein [Mycobacterium tuberculosis]